MNNLISMDKKYHTRGGRAVRILCVDRITSYPVVGLMDDMIHSWTSEGLKNPNHMDIYDLIEDKPKIKVERWINILSDSDHPHIYTSMYSCEDLALEQAARMGQHAGYIVLTAALPFVWEGGK